MPDRSLDDLQSRYREVKRRLEELNELRKQDSDDYDLFEWERLNNEERALHQQIKEAGGEPGTVTSKPSAGTGDSTPESETPAPPAGPKDPDLPTYPEGDPRRDLVDRVRSARRKVEEVEARTPERPVTLDTERGEVKGGTEEELQAQLRWRRELDEAEHERAVAEAELAFEAGGGLGAFTKEELDDLRRRAREIAADQAALDKVDGEIAKYEDLLRQARGQLDGNVKGGGGPSAGGAGAVAAGARYQGELRRLYGEQAEIRKRMIGRLKRMAQRIRDKIRRLIELGGRRLDLEIHVPDAKKHRLRAEEELLRRIYRRLGFPKLPGFGADGLLGRGRRRRGLSSVVPSHPLIAVAALLVLVLLVAGVLLTGGGDDGSEAISDAAEADTADADSTDDVGDGSTVGEALADDPVATQAVAGLPCAIVTHRPPADHPGSLSYFTLVLLVAGADGDVPQGSEIVVEVDGADAQASADLDARGIGALDVPISSYGTYDVAAARVRVPDGTEIDATDAVRAAAGSVTVGAAEGPVDDCVDPRSATDDELAVARSDLGAYDPAQQSSEEPAAEAGGDDPPASLREFLNAWIDAHRRGDAAFLLESLDDATIERYGVDQCRGYLTAVAGSVESIQVVSAHAEPYDYALDGMTTVVQDSWTLDVDVVARGSSDRTRTTMHLHPTDEGVRWFTDCGDPV